MRRLPLLLGLLLGACAVHEHRPQTAPTESPDYSFEVTWGVAYSPAGWPQSLAADVFQPQGVGRFPAVLLVHGGGWSRGSRAQTRAEAERLARSGFVVMNISYRLAPETRFPGQLHDLQQAMHWLHQHADDFAIDTRRIAGFGYSAGAHLVALLALLGPDSELDRPHGGPQTRLDAVVAGGTPADLSAYEESGKLLIDFMGDSKQQMPERYRAASPITHVSPAAPPFFLYHGEWDWLVPIAPARTLAAQLRAAGTPVEFYRLRFRGHFLAAVTDGGAQAAGIGFLRRRLGAATPPQSTGAR